MSETPPLRTPPGFFPDPEGTPGLERWWDGVQWTNATRSFAGPPPAPKSRPLYRTPLFMLAMVAVVVIAVIAIATGSTSDKEDSPKAVSTSATATSTGYPSELRGELASRNCQDAVRNQLRNPDSADFRGVRVLVRLPDTEWVVTGQVNGDNAVGGKAGFTAFTCQATWDVAADNASVSATIS